MFLHGVIKCMSMPYFDRAVMEFIYYTKDNEGDVGDYDEGEDDDDDDYDEEVVSADGDDEDTFLSPIFSSALPNLSEILSNLELKVNK
jgi:hypothetical protein